MKLGLRVDVDTLRGTRQGVPALLQILARHQALATFFFSVGPDNMGRHLRRLLRPTFAWKMLRTRAAKLYGWEILLRGTLWPGPKIGERCADVLRATEAAGHEVGMHAWDHHAWQAHIDRMTPEEVDHALRQGTDVIEEILGHGPTCSAVPGWRCNESVLEAKSRLPFRYNSDCRGSWSFRPLVRSGVRTQPQIPVTLPTFDEVVGRDGIDPSNYNDHLLSLLRPDQLNVLTIHAEVEGLAHAGLFDQFLGQLEQRGWECVPLGRLLPEGELPVGRIADGPLAGRDGPVALQEPVVLAP